LKKRYPSVKITREEFERIKKDAAQCARKNIVNKYRLPLLAAALIVIGTSAVFTACTQNDDGTRGGMMSGMMRGMMDKGMGGMMDDMSQMNDWLAGKTIPLDLETKRPPENAQSVKTGKEIYKVRCSACHGLTGDGNGEKAKELKTKPADFTSGLFKFRSTLDPAPTNLDIFKTISRGLHGTAMLPWPGLTTTEKWQVAYYIKTFSDLFESEEPKALKSPPYTMSIPQYVKLGKEVYWKAKCYECHGLEGRGDGEKADKLKDDKLRPIRPMNFRENILKRGIDLEEIYYTIATGLNGTPMESYRHILKEDEMFALSHYVQSIARKPSDRGMMMGMMGGDITPDERKGMMIDHPMMP